jgi:hypothetical protein
MKFTAIKTTNNWFKIDNVEAVQRFLSGINTNLLIIDIDKPKKKRNLSQNALFHAILSEIDKHIGNNDLELTKYQVKIHIGHYKEVVIKDKIEKYPLPTAKLEKSEFAELITRVLGFAWDFHQLDLTPIEKRGY